MSEILIVQRNKQKMEAKVRKRVSKGFSPNDYQKFFDPRNCEDLALLFEDLNLMYNSPIEKAFQKFREKKNRGFPF